MYCTIHNHLDHVEPFTKMSHKASQVVLQQFLGCQFPALTEFLTATLGQILYLLNLEAKPKSYCILNFLALNF